tara:strand:+ start:105 stop:251 length:147 start_codon:yes stop_codon:yes gene_type:complete
MAKELIVHGKYQQVPHVLDSKYGEQVWDPIQGVAVVVHQGEQMVLMQK